MDLFTWFFVPNWIIALRKFNFVSMFPIDGSYTLLCGPIWIFQRRQWIESFRRYAIVWTEILSSARVRCQSLCVYMERHKQDSREARKRQSTLTHSDVHPNAMTLCFAYCSFDNTTQNKYRRMNAQVSNCEQKCQNQSNHFTHHALAFHHWPNEIYTRNVSNATTDVISLVKTTILSRTLYALSTCRRTISKTKKRE